MSSRAIEVSRIVGWQFGFALAMLLLALAGGVLAAVVFVWPELGGGLRFERLRPVHVSAALFWILGGAVGCMLHFSRETFGNSGEDLLSRGFALLWPATALTALVCCAAGWFGGREYWEFPPLLSLPLLLAWLALIVHCFRAWSRRRGDVPLYAWMWGTGLVFFLIAFAEQNLHLLAWFRDDYVRAVTVQWKSNGSLVGAWNQLVYGTSLFVLVQLSGDRGAAQGARAQAFFLLGVANLMFNWGHHVYNVPVAGWIRHLAYAVSMTEWILFIAILRGFRRRLEERRRLGHLGTYRLLFAAELWLCANLLLALLMSIPAVNRHTHGTHITVAHGMGTTIGINTMLLLGAIGYALGLDRSPPRRQVRLARWFWLAQGSLLVFFLALVAAGLLKGWHEAGSDPSGFHAMMRSIHPLLAIFAISGLGLAAGLGGLAIEYLRVLLRTPWRSVGAPSDAIEASARDGFRAAIEADPVEADSPLRAPIPPADARPGTRWAKPPLV